MGNKASTKSKYDGLPPPIIPLDEGGKKKKDKKSKKNKSDKDNDKDSKKSRKGSSEGDQLAKTNGLSTGAMQTAGHSTGTLFRPPMTSPDEAEGQLSKVILPDQELDIKVYKKSRDNLNDNFDRTRRYRSLPRSQSAGFRKSTDTLVSCGSKQTDRLNHLHQQQQQQQQKYNSFAYGNVSFNSRWSYVNGSDSPTFRPPGLKGVTFPSEETILKHATAFERTYVESFVDRYYASLSDLVKLSAVIIAYKRIHGVGELDYRPISLREYFGSPAAATSSGDGEERRVPPELCTAEAKRCFVPAVPDSLLAGLVGLRGRGGGGRGGEDDWDESQVRAAMDLVRHVTVEAARELSRIYEYQLSVVSDVASVQILARHAAERSAEYLRSGNRFVERDSLVEGVAYRDSPGSGSHRSSFTSDGRGQSPVAGYVSAIFGEEREQRWEVSHVFASCGLRLDGGGGGGGSDGSGGGSGCSPTGHLTRPVFLTSRDALPLVYGYRGPICKRDFETGVEGISQTELALFPDVLQDNPDDFHRDYVPLRIAATNRSSSFDSQSTAGSLSAVENANRSGRISRQSGSVLAGHGVKVNGQSRAGVRTSTLAPGGRYGSLARSVDFDPSGHQQQQQRGPIHSRSSFQRDAPTYQSERAPISGGRLQGYSANRPERISFMNGHNNNGGETNNFERTTMRRACNGNGLAAPNRSMNGSVSSLLRNQPGVTAAGDVTSPTTRQPMAEADHHRVTNGQPARLPPKPPVRSSSQYNGHYSHRPYNHQFQTSFGTLQGYGHVPVTAPVIHAHQRLPPTTETSFDCDPEVENEFKVVPGTAPVVNGRLRVEGTAPDFMDFTSFLKLVECQNANLKSLDQVARCSKPVAGRQPEPETDFPEVEVQSDPTDASTAEVVSDV